MVEVHNSLGQSRSSRYDAWKSWPEAGGWSVKAVATAGLVAVLATPLVATGASSFREAIIKNAVEKYPDGILPSFGDGDAILPSLELDAKGEATIDFSALVADLDIERFEGSYDVKIADAIIKNDARTTTNYDIKNSATIAAYGKEVRIPLPVFNYDVHKYLEGTVRQQFFVPAEAVKGVSVNGRTNVMIDASQLEMSAGWVEEPSLTPYAVNKDGEMDFQDQTGLIEGYVAGVAGAQTMVGFNNLKNELNRMDDDSERYIKDSALAITASSCANSFDEPLIAAIEKGYHAAAVQQFGVDPDTLNIIVEGNPKISAHYDKAEDVSKGAVVAPPPVDESGTRLEAETTVTNPPEDALRLEFSCDDSTFEVVNGDSDD